MEERREAAMVETTSDVVEIKERELRPRGRRAPASLTSCAGGRGFGYNASKQRVQQLHRTQVLA